MKITQDMISEINAEVVEAPRFKRVAVDELKSKSVEMARRGYRFDGSGRGLEVLSAFLAGRNIMLAGPVGVGKTFFFWAAGVKNALNLKMVQGFSRERLKEATLSYCKEPVLIDDLGAEESLMMDYGSRVELLPEVLEIRQDSAAPTYFTTNLTPHELRNRYGDRVVDRLMTGMAFFSLSGESKRSPNTRPAISGWFSEFIKGKLWENCAERCKYYDCDSHRCIKGIEYEPRKVEACRYL